MPAPIAVSMGDPAGIGPEITAKAWRDTTLRHPFYLIADPACLPEGIAWREIASPAEAAAVFGAALPVMPLALAGQPSPGMPAPGNAAATVEAIRLAVKHARSRSAAAVVTNPINKKVLYDGAGFAFPGHTEFLAELGKVERSVMMIAGPSLRVVPVTIHIPLADVPAALSREAIVETARITAKALRVDFDLPSPRLAVAGLNPHAGESGAMGREEIEIIAPALATLRAEGIDVAGPLPADTMFHAAARSRYDAALTMYHDQGLIPVKALDFDQGVNVTLGLPFIRTSPDHGTAYDIAGTGRADSSSMIAALNMAGDMALRRAGRNA
ncbi:MAG: 4-hydroxythreonine-4-phosphate dehydrogenase PdxA [Pseudomonadota bacterium]